MLLGVVEKSKKNFFAPQKNVQINHFGPESFSDSPMGHRSCLSEAQPVLVVDDGDDA